MNPYGFRFEDYELSDLMQCAFHEGTGVLSAAG